MSRENADRVIIHEADEDWNIPAVIANDLPALLSKGFKYAKAFIGCEGEWYVYGHYTRGRAVRDAMKLSGDSFAFDAVKRERIY